MPFCHRWSLTETSPSSFNCSLSAANLSHIDEQVQQVAEKAPSLSKKEQTAQNWMMRLSMTTIPLMVSPLPPLTVIGFVFGAAFLIRGKLATDAEEQEVTQEQQPGHEKSGELNPAQPVEEGSDARADMEQIPVPSTASPKKDEPEEDEDYLLAMWRRGVAEEEQEEEIASEEEVHAFRWGRLLERLEEVDNSIANCIQQGRPAVREENIRLKATQGNIEQAARYRQQASLFQENHKQPSTLPKGSPRRHRWTEDFSLRSQPNLYPDSYLSPEEEIEVDGY